MKTVVSYLVMLVSVPLAWLAITHLVQPQPMIFPPLGLVLEVLREEAGFFLWHTWVTLREALVGYFFANLIAVGLAVSYLYLPSFEGFTKPWMVMVKNVPFPAVAAILVVTMDDTIWPKVIIVVLVCFYPILANVSKGLHAVDRVLLDRMQTLHATRWQVFRQVRWPAAFPYYMAAHENAFTASIIGAIVAEWLFSQSGLGYIIVQATTEYRGDRLYAATLVSSLLAILAYFLVCAIERWWRSRHGMSVETSL